MRTRSVGPLATMIVVLAVVVSVAPTAAIPADSHSVAILPPPATDGPAGPTDGDTRNQVETDNVRLTVDVLANGSAGWTVEYQTVLDNENTTAAFESLQDDIRQNRSAYSERFAERIRTTVRAAENATGREMSATNFGVETRIEQVGCPSPNGCGVITYTFRWQGFARVEDGGDRLVIGDAIEGFFLDQDTRLEIGWPEDYARVEVAPEPDGSSTNAVLWRGSSTDFVSGEPTVVVGRDASPTTDGGTNGGDGTTPTTTEGDATESGGIPLIPIAAVIVLLVLAGGIALWRQGALGDVGPTGGAEDADPSGVGGTVSPDTGGGEGGGAVDQEDADQIEIDQELLSNEEQVLKLLEAREGRLKQQEVVTELGWTEAKTSQVISGMREDGSIDTFRLGRENVVTLPDQDLGIGPDETDESR